MAETGYKRKVQVDDNQDIKRRKQEAETKNVMDVIDAPFQSMFANEAGDTPEKMLQYLSEMHRTLADEKETNMVFERLIGMLRKKDFPTFRQLIGAPPLQKLAGYQEDKWAKMIQVAKILEGNTEEVETYDEKCFHPDAFRFFRGNQDTINPVNLFLSVSTEPYYKVVVCPLGFIIPGDYDIASEMEPLINMPVITHISLLECKEQESTTTQYEGIPRAYTLPWYIMEQLWSIQVGEGASRHNDWAWQFVHHFCDFRKTLCFTILRHFYFNRKACEEMIYLNIMLEHGVSNDMAKAIAQRIV